MFNSIKKIAFLFIFLLIGSNAKAQMIEFSPDGQTVAVNWMIDFSVGQDISQFIVYDTKLGKIKSSLNTEDLANRMIFSSDSKNLVFAERLILEKAGFNAKGEFVILDNPVSIENSSIDRENQEFVNSELLGIALAADGKTVYKIYPNFLTAFSFPDFTHLPAKNRRLELKEPPATQNNFVGISRDARFVVEIEYKNNKSALLVKETGKPDIKFELSTIEEGGEFPAITSSISKNNEVLMISSENMSELNSQVGFWNLKTKKFIGNMEIPFLDDSSGNQFYLIDSVVISPDGKKAAARFDSFDKDSQEVSMIAVFDIPTQKTSYISVKKQSGVRFAEAMVFSPDSKNLATLSSILARASFAPRVEIWNVDDGKKIRQFE